MSCNDNNASLSWDASPNAVGYTGMTVDMNGHNVTWDAPTPGCQLGALRCGQMYTVTVSASDGSCKSASSAEYRFETGIRHVDTHTHTHTQIQTGYPTLWSSTMNERIVIPLVIV